MRHFLMVSARAIAVVASCALPAFIHADDVAVADRRPDATGFRPGDIVLQHRADRLTSVLRELTQSPCSHCGLVVPRSGQIVVLEAADNGGFVALDDWLAAGYRGEFAQYRPRDMSPATLAATLRAAARLAGRPDDLQFELDDHKIYAAELVFRAFQRGAAIDLVKPRPLGELQWKPHADYVRTLLGGQLPLDRLMVTPAALAHSPHLELIRSTFPAPVAAAEKRRKDLAAGRLLWPHAVDDPQVAPGYSSPMLHGAWHGAYSAKRLQPATARLQFGLTGEFETGVFQEPRKPEVTFHTFGIPPFVAAGEFAAIVGFAAGSPARAAACILDGGDRLMGVWQDDQGNRGLFSLVREPAAETPTAPAR